jgi:hypothetical protein
MKKWMMVMTIVAVLSFLVSVIAVTPSGAAEAIKTRPTTKQAPTTKQFTGQKQMVQTPKEKFWDLEVDHCDVNNRNICSKGYNLEGPWEVRCFYKVKTIPIGDITEADANYWGSGKSYTISASWTTHDKKISLRKEDSIRTPQFTWEDVLAWKRSAVRKNAPKVWTEKLEFTWHASDDPTHNYLKDFLLTKGDHSFLFLVDKNNGIEEYVERNNTCRGILNIPNLNWSFLFFEKRGGNIIVDSQVGKGATFTIHLPVKG